MGYLSNILASLVFSVMKLFFSPRGQSNFYSKKSMTGGILQGNDKGLNPDSLHIPLSQVVVTTSARDFSLSHIVSKQKGLGLRFLRVVDGLSFSKSIQ